jgi:hypothetical protein
MKHPNTNIQAPEKSQAPSSNGDSMSHSDLRFGTSLDVGAWSLDVF